MQNTHSILNGLNYHWEAIHTRCCYFGDVFALFMCHETNNTKDDKTTEHRSAAVYTANEQSVSENKCSSMKHLVIFPSVCLLSSTCCKTGKFCNRKNSRILGSGKFMTGTFSEFLVRRPSTFSQQKVYSKQWVMLKWNFRGQRNNNAISEQGKRVLKLFHWGPVVLAMGNR